MKIEVFVFNPIQENTYVVIDDTTNKCGIIDAGCRSRMEKVKLKKFIEQNGLTPVALLNTHLHFDHIYGNKFILETYGLKTYASPKDQFFIDTFIDQLNIFQMPADEQAPEIGTKIKEGDVIEIGSIKLQVIETPGHSAGSICFYAKEQNVCFTGDTIFKQSVGRTDFPTGSQREIMESITGKLLRLPDDTILYPGHGESTDVAWEKLNNPYLEY